jgi:hypothetical protein
LQYNYGNLFYGEGEITDHERSSWENLSYQQWISKFHH